MIEACLYIRLLFDKRQAKRQDKVNVEMNMNLSEQIYWEKDSFGPDIQIKLEHCKYL